MRRTLKATFLGFAVLVWAVAPGGAAAESKNATSTKAGAKARKLKAEGWGAGNLPRLQKLLEEHGRTSPAYTPAKKPVAVFDWDNTVIKNDVGDATLFWMASNNLIRKPKDWRQTSAHLTDAAVQALTKSCADLPDPLPTKTSAACADTILSIYSDGKLSDGTAAWKGTHDPDKLEPAYAWAVQLMSGHTPRQLTKIAEDAIRFNLRNPVGAKQKIGSKEYTAYVRIYPQIRNLIEALHESGFDVWISSASAQPIVEPFAKRVGVDERHVIGVRPALDEEGRITPSFQDCVGSGVNSSFINYRLGKRCWINKVVFGMQDEKLLETPSPIEFAAGDSDTDIFFLRDARALRLAINRNKTELMCHAFANADGKWIVNPMFIEPRAQKASAYECAKYGLPDQAEQISTEAATAAANPTDTDADPASGAPKPMGPKIGPP